MTSSRALRSDRELQQHLCAGGGALKLSAHPHLRSAVRRQLERGDAVIPLPGVVMAAQVQWDWQVRLRATRLWRPEAALAGRVAARLTFWEDAEVSTLDVVLARHRGETPDWLRVTTLPLSHDRMVWRGDIPFLRHAPAALVGGAHGDLEPLFNGLRQKAFTPAVLREISRAAPKNQRSQWWDLAMAMATNPWSAGELDSHRFLTATGFRRWVANPKLVLEDRVACPDVLFEGSRTVFELQSRKHHAPDEDRQSDWERHNSLTSAGYTVLHVTPRDLVQRPDRVVGQLLALVRRSEAPQVGARQAQDWRCSGIGP